MRLLACLGLVLSLTGCGDNHPAGDMSMMGADLSMSAGDMTATEGCGAMGDVGNSKHVGQYCDSTHMCPMGTTCASLFFPGATFCTIANACTSCPAGMGCTDTAFCGENTVCIYSSMFNAAGCAPAACSGLQG